MVDFDSLKASAFAWQDSARELVCAANILRGAFERSLRDRSSRKDPFVPHEGDIWRPMMVLYALAVENLVKAVIIARGEDPAPHGTLAGWFRHHNLVSHVSRAKLSFMPQQELLEKLRDFIESGKYPIGKDPDSGHRSKALSLPEDIDAVFALLDGLEDELRSILPRRTFPKTDLRQIGRGGSDSMAEIQ